MIEIIDLENNKISTIDVPEILKYEQYNPTLLKEVLEYHNNQLRLNCAHVKTKNELSYSKRKRFKQKGTGRARASNLKQSQHKGGPKLFGPNGRIYSYNIPQRKVQKAISIALTNRLNTNSLKVIDNLDISGHKTKDFANILGKLDVNKCLIVDNKFNENIKRASNNLFKVNLCEQTHINALKIISKDQVIITKDALEQLNGRIINNITSNKKEKING